MFVELGIDVRRVDFQVDLTNELFRFFFAGEVVGKTGHVLINGSPRSLDKMLQQVHGGFISDGASTLMSYMSW